MSAANLLVTLQSAPLFRWIGKQGAYWITVRHATPADLRAVHAILNPGGLYEARLPDPSWTSLIAERSGRLVGSVDLVRHNPEHAPYTGYWLSSLVVFRLWNRGLGVGEALTRALVGLSRKEQAPAVFLVVYEENRAAIRLYEKCGFVRTTLPGIEEELEAEAREYGRRRIAMVIYLDERE